MAILIIFAVLSFYIYKPKGITTIDVHCFANNDLWRGLDDTCKILFFSFNPSNRVEIIFLMIKFCRSCLCMSRMRRESRYSPLVIFLLKKILFSSIVVFMPKCWWFQIFEALKINLWLHQVLLSPYHVIVKLLLQISNILHFDLHLWRLLGLSRLWLFL